MNDGTDMTPTLPVPVPDRDTQPFWDACAEQRLSIQRCAGCARWIWQPMPLCPTCHRPDPVWTDVSGDGTVASWTVIRPPVFAAYAERTPFVILLVELVEGVRLLGYLVDEAGGWLTTDGEAQGIAMGALAELRWHRQDGRWLPSWTLRPPGDR